MNGPVLIMSALPEELEALTDLVSGVDHVEVGGTHFLRGTVESHAVVAAAVGVGKVNAAMVSTLAFDHFEPRAVLVTGVAGSLDETIEIGDVVVAERVVSHDTGVLGDAGLERYQPGHIAFLNPTQRFGYAPPPDLLERIRDLPATLRLNPVLGREPRIVFGTIATGDQFVNSESVRRRLWTELGARAVDMEGAAVAQVAEHFGVPCLVIRAVSDLAGKESEVDFTRFLAEAAANSILLVTALLPNL